MSTRELRRAVRHASKVDRLGADASCEVCGERDVRVLRKVGARVLCANCHKKLQGQRPFEQHHIAGRKNSDATIPLPANLHSILSDAQYDWPSITLRNPSGNQFIRIAAWFRGIHDLLAQLTVMLQTRAEWFEVFSAVLENNTGSNWSTRSEEKQGSNDEK